MTDFFDLSDQETVTKIGRVFSVEGRRVSIAVDKSKNGSHLLFQGRLLRNVSVGGYVKIAKGFSEIVAQVDGERVSEDKTGSVAYQRSSDKIRRILDVSLVGFFDGDQFNRGIREMPLLDNECFLLTEDEFDRVHNFIGHSNQSISIGTLAMEPNQQVRIGIDDLFASHIGIFGNTGSGKSYTLVKIYNELFEIAKLNEEFRETARFLLIDFNGEYVDLPGVSGSQSTSIITDPELKETYVLSTASQDGDTIPLSASTIRDPIFWSVLLDATEKTQAPFLRNVLASTYLSSRLGDDESFRSYVADLVVQATKGGDGSMDPNIVINLLRELQSCLCEHAPEELEILIDDFQENLNYNSTLKNFYWGHGAARIYDNQVEFGSILRQKIAAVPLSLSSLHGIDLIRFEIVMQYYSRSIRGFSNREHLAPMIKRLESRITDIKKLIRIEDTPLLKKPLTIIAMKDVDLSMRKVVPMLICKHLYDKKKLSDPNGQRLLNFIIDEAHSILSSESVRESESWRDYRLETFEEIVKEGRKFGVFLTIASQRPHDISETIVSQLHNYFLHRLVNNLDIRSIEKAVSYLDRVSFDSLPILPTGTCVVSGISAQVPVVVSIGTLPPAREPTSTTLSLSSSWHLGSME
jgi:hypothetical protein